MYNFLFYFPSRSIGGTQYLYSRCANYLANNYAGTIYYVDYVDGFAKLKLLDSKVIVIEKKDGPVKLPENTICVIQFNFLDTVFEKISLNDNCQILFWAITPSSITKKINLHNIPLLRNSEKAHIGSALNRLSSIHNLIYMDHENYYINSNTFKYHLSEPTYVPVPIDDNFIVSDIDFNNHKDFSHGLRFAWLGRIDKDKVPTLITFMNEIESVKQKCKALYIIGDGDSINNVKSISGQYSYKICFVGSKINKQLNKFIDENVDVGLGMGLSALEFTKRGKPAILRGFMNKVQPAGLFDNYIFVSQMYKYTPGTPYAFVDGHSYFKTKVNELIDNYSAISKDCYDYTCSNHIPEITCKILCDVATKLMNTEIKNTLDALNKCNIMLGRAKKRSNILISLKKIFKRK